VKRSSYGLAKIAHLPLTVRSPNGPDFSGVLAFSKRSEQEGRDVVAHSLKLLVAALRITRGQLAAAVTSATIAVATCFSPLSPRFTALATATVAITTATAAPLAAGLLLTGGGFSLDARGELIDVSILDLRRDE
jgi:hypothetical protein